jgi:hypothetical protein
MVFVSFRKLFSDNTRVRIFIFFVARKALIFSPEFNIRLYDKNSESDYIFFLHQNQNIFFRKKTPFLPPLQVRWSVPRQVHDRAGVMESIAGVSGRSALDHFEFTDVRFGMRVPDTATVF